MRVFVDTSAFLAVIDKDEANHAAAARLWQRLVNEDARMVCSNYVLLETVALLQHRFGMALVKAFQERVAPVLHIEWISAELHETGMAALLTANRRQLSLVDCLSFEVCRRLGIDTVFAFDRHFTEQGFSLLA